MDCRLAIRSLCKVVFPWLAFICIRVESSELQSWQSAIVCSSLIQLTKPSMIHCLQFTQLSFVTLQVHWNFCCRKTRSTNGASSVTVALSSCSPHPSSSPWSTRPSTCCPTRASVMSFQFLQSPPSTGTRSSCSAVASLRLWVVP